MATKPNIIITGVPRSGTTLTCLLLSKLPDVVALNEPMRTAHFADSDGAMKGTDRFFADTRRSLLESGTATARVVKGKMTDNHFARVRGKRVKLVKKEEIKINKPLSENFTLACKHNALFTLLREPLERSYPYYAIVRNPLAVLASWNSLDFPASRGEVSVLDRMQPAEAERLRTAGDLHDRQLYIIDWYFRNYDALPRENVIRYEDIVATNGTALRVVHPAAEALREDLQGQNRSKVYDWSGLAPLAQRLLASDNACWRFYDRSEAEALLR